MPATLAPELLRTIFTEMAELSTSSCCTLCAVSSWTRHIALPLLYENVFLDSSFFRLVDTVRRLWAPSISETLTDVLQYSFPNPFERQDKSAEKGDLHVVLLQNYPLPTINSTHPLLRRITHLELEEPIKPGASQPISVMPNLTHLAVLIRITEGGLGWIFDMISGTSIKVFALIWDQWISGRDLRAIEAWLRKSRRKGDERIYMVWRNEIPSVDWDNEPDPDPVVSARLDEDEASRERVRFALRRVRIPDC
ncbi:hypothetical protein BD779DRAFT_1677715 [Infundibulicybe gibba]|nr:hypothetical protein BD779DRAFT_1677715 [Infundibulicybe gibba]